LITLTVAALSSTPGFAVNVAVYVVPDPLKLLSEPSAEVTSLSVKSVGDSMNVKVTVAVEWATLMWVLSIDAVTVGVTVSTVNGAVLSPAPALPFTSCHEPAVTPTEAVLMSVLAERP
jgi:hypothetical protein